jgi:hypothetical protein
MSAARPLPTVGSIFLDSRGSERALRVSWHSEADVVVLSLWRDNVCVASFRLGIEEVPELIELLRVGLQRSYRHAPNRLPDSSAV